VGTPADPNNPPGDEAEFVLRNRMAPQRTATEEVANRDAKLSTQPQVAVEAASERCAGAVLPANRTLRFRWRQLEGPPLLRPSFVGAGDYAMFVATARSPSLHLAPLSLQVRRASRAHPDPNPIALTQPQALFSLPLPLPSRAHAQPYTVLIQPHPSGFVTRSGSDWMGTGRRSTQTPDTKTHRGDPQVGAVYRFQLTASYAANPGIAAAATVAVTVTASPLVVRLAGCDRSVSAGRPLYLEAVVEDADQLDAPVHYTWTCTRPTDEDEAAAEAGERCFDRNVGTGVDVKLCGLFDSSTP
jgi:hypothetical protein